MKRIPDPERYRLRYLGIVQVKGRQQPVGIYECFDGDESAEIILKTKTLDTFNRAVAHFFDRSFSAASADFQTILQHYPTDTATKLFLEKSNYYLQNGIPDDWTGMEKMTGK